MRSGRRTAGGSGTQPTVTVGARAAVVTRVVTVGLWLVVLSGPVLGVAALLSEESAPGAARSERPEAREPRRGLELMVGEFGVRFVSAWLGASGEDGEVLEEFVAVVPGLPEVPVVRRAGSVRVAEAVELAPGLWSVTLAGEVELAIADADVDADVGTEGEWWGPVTKFWRVGVRVEQPGPKGRQQGRPGGVGLVATGMPTEVAAPSRAGDVESVFGEAVDGAPGALGEAVGSFLALYLTGDPDLERYVTPEAELAALPDTGVVEAGVLAMAAATPQGKPVDLDELASDGAPRDGLRLQVLATVLPRTDAGELPVQQYVLSMATRAGRWEVAGLEPAVRPAATSEAGNGSSTEGR